MLIQTIFLLNNRVILTNMKLTTKLLIRDMTSVVIE